MYITESSRYAINARPQLGFTGEINLSKFYITVTTIVPFLFLFSVDFGLLGSTNNFTTAGAFADIICSTTTVTISGAIAAWMLGREKIVNETSD